MVLLGVMRDDVVDSIDAGGVQAVHQGVCFRRVHRIEQGDLLAPFHQIGVVRRPLGQGDQLVEKPTIPVNGANRIDIRPQFLHLGNLSLQKLLCSGQRGIIVWLACHFFH